MKLIPIFLMVGLLAVSGWAEESQVPFKVGDVVSLREPFSTLNQDEQWSLTLIVSEIKGKWVASKGKDIKGNDGNVYRSNTWYNTDRYLYIVVNEPKELSEYGLIQPMPKPNPNLPNRRPIIPIPEPDSAELLKRAESGDATAQWELGCCYMMGTRVGKDEKEAVKWFIKSAEQGFAKAQALLGGCYERGKGVEKDAKEAVKWYTKAAEQGNEGAQLSLGKCYSDGTGVGKDEKEAVKWYTKAAEQGFAVAQYELGVHYENGTGAGKDEKEAVKWFTKAAEQGNEGAKKALEKLKSN